MPKSTYLNDNFINVALRNTVFVSPPTVWCALYTASPGVGGGGTEVAGPGGTAYALQIVTFIAPTLGIASNDADVNFPVATGDYGTITSFALLDASSGGNLLYFGNLSTPRLVLTNDQVRFPLGQFIVQES